MYTYFRLFFFFKKKRSATLKNVDIKIQYCSSTYIYYKKIRTNYFQASRQRFQSLKTFCDRPCCRPYRDSMIIFEFFYETLLEKWGKKMFAVSKTILEFSGLDQATYYYSGNRFFSIDLCSSRRSEYMVIYFDVKGEGKLIVIFLIFLDPFSHVKITNKSWRSKYCIYFSRISRGKKCILCRVCAEINEIYAKAGPIGQVCRWILKVFFSPTCKNTR